MTVPKSQRGESRLHVHVELRKLIDHTLKKTKNSKKFGCVKTYVIERGEHGEVVSIEEHASASRQALANRIEHAVILAGECAWRANDLRIETDYPQRRKLQDECIRNLDALMWLIEVSRLSCGLSGREVRYWSDMARDTRNLVRKWKDSDAKRHRAS